MLPHYTNPIFKITTGQYLTLLAIYCVAVIGMVLVEINSKTLIPVPTITTITVTYSSPCFN